MQVNKTILLIGVFCVVSFYGAAQSSCVQNLRDARSLYDEGRLNELPDLLQECIENGFSKEEKVEALRLVTLSHLFNEEQQRAENSYLRLLNINPEFQPNKDSDPTELLILAESFDTDPKFFFGVKGGASYNIIQGNPEIIHSQIFPGSYEFPLGLSGGVFFQYPINDIFSVNIEAFYNYRNTILNRPIGSEESNTFHTIDETQQWIEMPLLVNYRLPWVDKFLLEATAGPSVQYLISSNLSVKGLNGDLINFDMLPYRNQFNMSGIVGMRANFKEFGANFITVEMLFQYKVLSEVNKKEMSETVKVNLADVGFTDFNYRGHALWLRLGLRFPYFKPEIIK